MKRNDCQKCTAPKCTLPEGAVHSGETPVFNERTVPAEILHRHLAPRGKCALLSVRKGKLELVFEENGERVTVTPEQPAVIEPGRFHHVEPHPGVEFKIAFYSVPERAGEAQCDAPRPGERYLKRN